MSRPKIALSWCAGCGGCEESVIDLGGQLVELLASGVEVVYWPVALDAKLQDLERLQDGVLAASFINGALRTEDDLRMARLLRAKSQLVFAHGACAHLGGVLGLANFSTTEALLDRVYQTVETLAEPGSPPVAPGLPQLLPRVFRLCDGVEVDYTIPGCPPTPQLVGDAMRALVEGALPPRGSIFGDPRALCDSCSRRETLPKEGQSVRFRRAHEVQPDSVSCFLAQGVLCAGPATRGGCLTRCIRANAPCRGCFGPAGKGKDLGARLVSLVAALGDTVDGESGIVDPAGLFYRYCVAASTLGVGSVGDNA